MQRGTLRNTELVEGKPESRLMSRTEIAVELDDTSGTDESRGLAETSGEMGPGNLTETSEEEYLRTGPEPLTIRIGKDKGLRVGTWVGTGSVDHRSMRFMSAPGFTVD